MSVSASPESLLDWLECPACRGDLQEDAARGLVCAQGHAFAVRDGVPLFCAPAERPPDLARTAAAFGARWKRFFPSAGYMTSRELLLDYVAPADEGFFRGKDVLDAGCGAGRFCRLAAQMGARAVFGVDVMDDVGRDEQGRRDRRWQGVQADLARLPFKRRFDFVMSLGVLHHLPRPEEGVRALARLVKPGGHLAVWVYGRENNGWIRRWIDPLRVRVTSRLPGWALEALCLPPGALLYAASRSRAGRALLRLLGGRAMDSYARTFLSRLGLWETVGIVYDHLVPPHAHYIDEQDVRAWFAACGLTLVSLTSRNANSWRALGRKAA